MVSSSSSSSSSSLSPSSASSVSRRQLQERKDIYVILVALEFHRLSQTISQQQNQQQHQQQQQNQQQQENDRNAIIDQVFTNLHDKQLDDKTMMQLRHEVQTYLHPQVVDLFHAFERVDHQLIQMVSTTSTSSSTSSTSTSTGTHSLESMIDLQDKNHFNGYESILQEELEQIKKELSSLPTIAVHQGPSKAPSPNEFLQLKMGAIETLLLDRRRRRRQQSQSQSIMHPAENETNDETMQEEDRISKDEEKRNSQQQDQHPYPQQQNHHSVSWMDADEFGYHETIDEEMNEMIRKYQMINICRSVKLKKELGYSVIALKSSIPGAGRGVYVDGYCPAGSIVAFQPGEVWMKEHLVSIPIEVEKELERNDNYQMSLRPDDHMIDSRKSPYTVLTESNSNMMAVGHIVNHPTPVNPPNCKSIMVNFTQSMELTDALKRYIPNTYARPRNLTVMGTFWDREAIDMHGMCLVATRDICNEELFYDYRLMTHHLPQWYHPVQETAFEEQQEES